TPGIAPLIAAQQTQLRTILGSLDAKTTFRTALTSPQSLSAVAIGTVLEDLERAVEHVDRQTDSEVALLAVWAESLREFGSWLRQPAVAWSTIGLVWFLVSYSWVTLKTERPDVADMLEVPFSLLASIVLPLLVAAAAQKKK
ncbi:hypothetical protein, partial [Micromonospora aurantiaca]|uniref:hypothetical protein n=1 Tax=Micromonospora aurantiaca (nom. illeg.) TaxID=47850 RepID=UPI003827226F